MARRDRRVTIRLAVLLGLACLIGTVAGQTPVFRSSTTSVVLDVVVTDSSERPVLDLEKEDFEVLQSGRPQTIDQFQRIVVPLGDRHPPNDDVLDSAPASNARPQPAARLFAFVLDEGTLLVEDIIPFKSAMRRFLQRLSPDDRMSATYVGRSDLSQDFTSDASRMVRAIDNFRAALGSAASNDLDPSSPVKSGDDLAALEVLNNVVRSLADAPEHRRVIVFVSRGTYPKRRRHDFEWLRMYDSATRAGIPIYTVDPTGIAAPELGFQLALENQTPENRRALDLTRRAAQNTLREIATNTGGRALVSMANVSDAVDQIVSENGGYYLLGFEPRPYPSAGRFQSVDVRVRRPGLRIRSRRGFTGRAQTTQAAAFSTQALSQSLRLGTPGGELPVRAVISRVVPSNSNVTAVLTLEVPSAGSILERAEADRLHLVWIALDPDGKERASGHRTLTVSPEAAQRAATISVVDRLELPRVVKYIRIAVASELRGTAGHVHLSTDDSEDIVRTPGASSLMIGVEGMKDVVLFRLGSVDQLVPFPPTTLRRLAGDHVLHLFCRVFLGNRGGLQATLRVTQSSKPVLVIPVQAERSTLVAGAFDLRSTVALASLSSGAYRFELSATTGDTTEIRRAVTVEIR